MDRRGDVDNSDFNNSNNDNDDYCDKYSDCN